MAGSASGEVERLEPWQLEPYLRRLEQTGASEVVWNRERIAMAEARRRAAAVSPTATVVVDGAAVYVAEPDHSPDNAPGIRPIPLGPRRP
jgi:hypothetical protein